MVYALTLRKESGTMPIYGQIPPPTPSLTSKILSGFTWQPGVKGDWDQQVASQANNVTTDQSRLSLPTRSGRWNASRRDW